MFEYIFYNISGKELPRLSSVVRPLDAQGGAQGKHNAGEKAGSFLSVQAYSQSGLKCTVQVITGTNRNLFSALLTDFL
jgi:hypothetical protein